MSVKAIVWFQRDLRLRDHPALYTACAKGHSILPLYIFDERREGESMGAASRWWLHHSLLSLQKDMKRCGLSLVLKKGDPLEVLKAIVQKERVPNVFWNRIWEPKALKKEKEIQQELEKLGCQCLISNGSCLFEPGTILNAQGAPYQVFTPFWKACLKEPPRRTPFPLPRKILAHPKMLSSLSLDALSLLPKKDWATSFSETWSPGEKGAQHQLKRFLKYRVATYLKDRDFPGKEGTSRLSPYLHFGEISPFTLWHEVHEVPKSPSRDTYLKELGWREFAYSFLHFFPKTPQSALQAGWDHFPWHKTSSLLKNWQKGQTGYPIVDAGMRQLWKTGWMHNRVRMIVGSFLVKDLFIRWQEGARWFWDTLVDADLANNTLGWQWVGGCGADAAPYFRVFNPTLQGEKFDPEGEYVRHFVPELSKIPAKWIHKPWIAPEEILKKAGVILGRTYPLPIVDHLQAKKAALDIYAKYRQRNTTD